MAFQDAESSKTPTSQPRGHEKWKVSNSGDSLSIFAVAKGHRRPLAVGIDPEISGEFQQVSGTAGWDPQERGRGKPRGLEKLQQGCGATCQDLLASSLKGFLKLLLLLLFSAFSEHKRSVFHVVLEPIWWSPAWKAECGTLQHWGRARDVTSSAAPEPGQTAREPAHIWFSSAFLLFLFPGGFSPGGFFPHFLFSYFLVSVFQLGIFTLLADIGSFQICSLQCSCERTHNSLPLLTPGVKSSAFLVSLSKKAGVWISSSSQNVSSYTKQKANSNPSGSAIPGW